MGIHQFCFCFFLSTMNLDLSLMWFNIIINIVDNGILKVVTNYKQHMFLTKNL